MKLISWNVNGLRACLTHDFAASFAALDADIFSVQETKMQPGQADFAPEGYTEYKMCIRDSPLSAPAVQPPPSGREALPCICRQGSLSEGAVTEGD